MVSVASCVRLLIIHVCTVLHLSQVNINEPVSMLQRMMEHVYYADLLTKASQAPTTLEELPYLAAFVLSAYPHTIYRMAKPFNPLLGETYECDRRAECGWRSFMEQVT